MEASRRRPNPENKARHLKDNAQNAQDDIRKLKDNPRNLEDEVRTLKDEVRNLLDEARNFKDMHQNLKKKEAWNRKDEAHTCILENLRTSDNLRICY